MELTLTFSGLDGVMYLLDETLALGEATESRLQQVLPHLVKRHCAVRDASSSAVYAGSSSLPHREDVKSGGCVARHHLSVDELNWLCNSGERCQPTVQLHRWGALVWTNGEAARLAVQARVSRCPALQLLCNAYRFLTEERGFQLRHGSAFGVDYIGYRQSCKDHHGSHLILVDRRQLTAASHTADTLDVVTLCRVARSVGKRAMIVTQVDGDFDIQALT